MKKKNWVLLVVAAVMVFWIGFYTGYLASRDVTVVSFQGMPNDAVIHFEVNKGAGTD